MLRKFSILILLLFTLCKSSEAQGLTLGNIENYSYYVQGVNGNDTIYNGSAFIIHSGSNYVLVSNFHVLSGKNPATNQKAAKMRELPTEIVVRFNDSVHNRRRKIGFPLLDSTGNIAYQVFYSETVKAFFDIAFLPISKPQGVDFYSIEENNLDNREELNDSSDIIIAGYPLGLFRIIIEKTINKKRSDGLRDSQLFFSISCKEGCSGSPVYTLDSNAKTLKVVGITSMGSIYDDVDLKGGAVYCYFLEMMLTRFKLLHP